MRLSLREFLVGAFDRARTPYLIGPGIDGDLMFSASLLRVSLPQALHLAFLAADYTMEHLVIDGVHIIHRVPDVSRTSDPTTSALQLQVLSLTVEYEDLKRSGLHTTQQRKDTEERLRRFQRLLDQRLSAQKATK